jgi:DNA ligase-1
MITHPTLYKRTSTGATQIWFVESEGSQYRTTSGQLDGKKVTSEWTTCLPKNVGKQNATTGETQCEAEVAALYRKKLAQGGYKETLDTIDTPNFFKPMLAKEFGDYPIKWGSSEKVFSQPKLDGMRCVIMSSGMFSREGKPINSAPHIFEAVKHLFEAEPNLVLDGELYNHTLKDNFNALMSLAKKQSPTSEQLLESKQTLQFHCYDLFDGSSETFCQRIDRVRRLLSGISPSIVIVPSVEVGGGGELDSLYEAYLRDGYEGQMIRHDTPYANKRTSALLKRKEMQDAEFRIVGWEEGNGNRSGMVGCITYALPDGRTFDSNLKGTMEYLKEVWSQKEKYTRGTVEFFHYTPEGKPRFPRTTKLYTD